jgi:hypothetical protein
MEFLNFSPGPAEQVRSGLLLCAASEVTASEGPLSRILICLPAETPKRGDNS